MSIIKNSSTYKWYSQWLNCVPQIIENSKSNGPRYFWVEVTYG